MLFAERLEVSCELKGWASNVAPKPQEKGVVARRQRFPDLRPHQLGRDAAAGSTPALPWDQKKVQAQSG